MTNTHFITSIRTAIFIALIILASSGSFYGQNPKVFARAQQLTGDQFRFITTTQNGAHVYAVNRPSSTVLRFIDKGLADLFAVAKKNGFSNKLRYRDYSIYIARADRTKDSSGQYSPDFSVRSSQYAGSVFDQGGFIYAAGMVIAFDPCSFVIAEHTKDFERISNVVRYEGEHIVLYHNDRRRHAETADHSKGGTHPILN